jgi:hypothetical protein
MKQQRRHYKHHKQLWAVCRERKRDYDERDRDYPQCAHGCYWYHPLEGYSGMDWGVCFNPDSPRAGLLTFEHMGCDHFECQGRRKDQYVA